MHRLYRAVFLACRCLRLWDGLTLCSCLHWLLVLPSHCSWLPGSRWRRPGWRWAPHGVFPPCWCAPVRHASHTPLYLGWQTRHPPEKTQLEYLKPTSCPASKNPTLKSLNVFKRTSLPCSKFCRSLGYLPSPSWFVWLYLKAKNPYFQHTISTMSKLCWRRNGNSSVRNGVRGWLSELFRLPIGK